MESLDILREGQHSKSITQQKMNILEAQTAWKQILQFLITQDYRLEKQ